MNFNEVEFIIARHFGFCYGVENAIEISYKALEENPDKRVFLLSQMIHNQAVNSDLESRGIQFIMDTDGSQFIGWDELREDDIVIIPAFGTTIEIAKILEEKGLDVKKYNTTCPFVEKVWKRSTKLGQENFSVIVHGKFNHEETRATFSHSQQNSPTLIIRDMGEAEVLAEFITGERDFSTFATVFNGRFSEGFDPAIHLNRLGVVNQTTMLATETQAIANYLKDVIIQKFGEENYKDHFADTRDTLCYATNDNQEATYSLLREPADFAVVVGGYNSSNTSHIVELCEQKMPTYFVNSDDEIKSKTEIHHFIYHEKRKAVTRDYIPHKDRVKIVLTSGASCPDTLVDKVLIKLLGFFREDEINESEINSVVEKIILQ